MDLKDIKIFNKIKIKNFEINKEQFFQSYLLSWNACINIERKGMLPHHVIPHADAVSCVVEFEIHRDELSFCEESHSLRLQKQVVAFRRS